MVRVEIDPNVRLGSGLTYVSMKDYPALAIVKEPVLLFESEEGLFWDGHVTIVDTENGLVYLFVDWTSVHRGEDV